MNVSSLKAHCESLVGIRHDIKWGGVDVYSVHQTKMVCIFYDDGKMACKVPEDLFIMMAAIPGCRPAPHLARAGWIEFGERCPLPTDELQNIISRSRAFGGGQIAQICSKGTEAGQFRPIIKHKNAGFSDCVFCFTPSAYP